MPNQRSNTRKIGLVAASLLGAAIGLQINWPENHAWACPPGFAHCKKDADTGCCLPQSCESGYMFEGGTCHAEKPQVVTCPAGMHRVGNACKPNVVACPSGTKFTTGVGCVPVVVDASRGQVSLASMISLPAGGYLMGSEEGQSDEKPVHRVTVNAFEIDKTEVTVEAYAACINDKTCRARMQASLPKGEPIEPSGYHVRSGNGIYFCNWKHPQGRNDHPVNCVSLHQAQAYCAAVGKRLPTEEEWEYAAGGSQGRRYPWGNEEPSSRHLNACGSNCRGNAVNKGYTDWIAAQWANDAFPETAPAGSFPEGATPEGVLDLAGNVWEWTSSGYSKTYGTPRTSEKIVVRGGGWDDFEISKLRGANRFQYTPSNRAFRLGFRCAR